MTLKEFMDEHPKVDEFTVWDEEYDIEMYFYAYGDDLKDRWETAMVKIAEHLEVVEEDGDDKVTVDLCSLIQRNLNNGVFEELFIHNDVDSIMEHIAEIFSGRVSDRWINEFADSLV